jgi:hypothetical protein
MAQQDIDEAYAVTDDGRVWSYKTNKWLRPAKASSGYLSVRLHGKTQSIHRLVASAFCENSEGKPCVNHIDGNKTNNCASNLEWCSHSENHKHAFETGLRFPSEKQKDAVRKQGFRNRVFSFEDAEKIRKLHKEGNTQTAIAKIFNTTQATVNNIVLGKTYIKEAV